MSYFSISQIFSIRQQVLNVRTQVAGVRQQVGSVRYQVPVAFGEFVNVRWELDNLRQQVPAEGWALVNKGQQVQGVRPITLSASLKRQEIKYQLNINTLTQ